MSDAPKASFTRAPTRGRLLVVVLFGVALGSLISGSVIVALSEHCGRGSGRACDYSLAPSTGLEFVGTLVMILALPFGVATVLTWLSIKLETARHPENRELHEPPLGDTLTADVSQSLTSLAPLRESARFQIERVVSILGEGCVVSGVLEAGTVRPPVRLWLIPGPGSSTVEGPVMVVAATAGRRSVEKVPPGNQAELTLRAIAETRTPGGILPDRGYWVQQGDQLVSR